MGRLLTVLIGTSHFLTGLILFILALPFFGIWRLLLLLLFCFEKILQVLPLPTITIYTPAYTHYLHHWQHFFNLPALSLVKTYHTRILATLLLVISTGLALAIFVKSSILYIPWLLNNFRRHSPDKHNELLFYTALYIATCAPLAFVFGAGTALFYYARKYWKYGKFEKNMRRKPGGRGYWADPTDKKGRKRGTTGRAAEKVNINRKPEREKETGNMMQRSGSMEKERAGWDEAVLYGGMGEGLDVLRRPERAVTLPEPAASFEGNKYTNNGVGSIWSNKVADQFKGGYDGRKTRKKAWEEDMEMNEGVGRK